MKNVFESQRAENELLLDDAYSRALRLDDPVDMADFSDLYKDVNVDLAYVEDMDRKFAESLRRETEVNAMFRKMAKVFEVIVSEQMEMSNWLGESAMTEQASKYDDYKNGVDTVVEFDEPDGASHLALAIDVTSSHELTRKFTRIKDEIDSGVLTKVKYFVSENLGIRGEKGNIPRVVIGADRKTIMDLVGRWMDKDNEALAEHVVQAIVIEEIIEQLEAYIKYAKKISKDKVASIYQRTLEILQRIKEEKKLSEDMIYSAREDQVLQAIQANLLDLLG
jgi:hypothetical protein